MKETFESYLQKLKDRRIEDDYKYTDEDFETHNEYIRDCWLTNLSVYKCLEFMYFETDKIKLNIITMNLPIAILQLRKEAKLSQSKFKLGKNQMSLIETGKVTPSIDTLNRICDTLGIKLSELIRVAENIV